MSSEKLYPSEQTRWRTSFFRTISIAVVVLLSILIALRRLSVELVDDIDFILAGLIITLLVLNRLVRRGYLLGPSILLIVLSWGAVNYMMWTGDGIYDGAVFAFFGVLLLCYLLLDWIYSLVVLSLSLISVWLCTYAQYKGIIIPEHPESIFLYARDITIVLLIVSALGYAYLRRINIFIARITEELIERIRTEKVLHDTRENYKFLFDEAAEGILIGNVDGEILLMNDVMSHMTGYSIRELKGKQITILFTPEEMNSNPLQMDLVKQGEVVENTRELLKKDGSKVYIQMRTKMLPDGRIQTFFTDISEHLLAQKSLRDFERIFNLSANPICISDLDGILMKVNPAFSNILGYSAEEFEGQHYARFLHPDDVEWTSVYLTEQIEQKTDQLVMENRYFAKDGTLIWFTWSIQPIYEEGIAFSVGSDITKLKIVEEELISAKESAEESDRLKTAFLANMSHEIRTPMNGILGFSEMFLTPDLSEEDRKHFAQIVINSGKRLMGMLDDIIDISRIETGKLEIVNEPVKVNQILDDLYDFYSTQYDNTRLEFTVEKSLSDLKSIILTDKLRLNQILNNLLSNAFKFTSRGMIRMGYELRDDFLEFFVTDTGIGIPEDSQELIFDRFQQASHDISRKYGGTGLGLAICKKLTELLGGTIWIKSKPGSGSSFYFTIPYNYKGYLPPEKGQIKDQPSRKNGSAVILIVEDDEVNYKFLESFLIKQGFNTKLAHNGQNAIDSVKKFPEIALVLMDIKLPGMDGLEATRKIKELNPKLPVIAQTAYAMSGDREKVLAAGCDHYISKPIAQDQLLELINQYL